MARVRCARCPACGDKRPVRLADLQRCVGCDMEGFDCCISDDLCDSCEHEEQERQEKRRLARARLPKDIAQELKRLLAIVLPGKPYLPGRIRDVVRKAYVAGVETGKAKR